MAGPAVKARDAQTCTPCLHCHFQGVTLPSRVIMRSMIADRNARALATLRICVALLFLIFAQYKVFGSQFTLGGGFQFWINRFLTEGAYPFMVPILQKFVLPHATYIAFLVAYGELAIGLALLTGILVRLASMCGVIYMLTLLFSANYPGPHAAFWQYFGASLEHLVLALCFSAFVLGDSVQVLLLRPYLRRRPGTAKPPNPPRT
jgi:thiosulfate dehydrogenase (quinone) large subunit